MKIPNKISLSTFNIYSNGNRSLNLIVDDIFRIAFESKITSSRIVVIPVDTKFNMELSSFEDFNKVVSIKTIHGQWIEKMEKHHFPRDKIDQSISCQHDSLIRTVVFNKTKFYLLPISKFDENNNAHSSVDILKETLKSLVHFYDMHDQGETLYIPLVGTGLSRAGLNHDDSINLIKEVLLCEKEYLNGTINIVLYTKDIEKLDTKKYGIQK